MYHKLISAVDGIKSKIRVFKVLLSVFVRDVLDIKNKINAKNSFPNFVNLLLS